MHLCSKNIHGLSVFALKISAGCQKQEEHDGPISLTWDHWAVKVNEEDKYQISQFRSTDYEREKTHKVS